MTRRLYIFIVFVMSALDMDSCEIHGTKDSCYWAWKNLSKTSDHLWLLDSQESFMSLSIAHQFILYR